MKYVIITPAFNEGENISKTLDSVVRQTVLPLEWIIVNDGSTDNTAQIVNEYAGKYPWIRLIDKAKSPAPFGANVIQNFYYGFDRLIAKNWNYIVKLDADLNILRDDHFEYQMRKMQEDTKLGITSGITFYTLKDGTKKTAWHPNWRTTGAMKFYRRQCFEQIGGIVPMFGWDGIDEYKAMYNGWKTLTFYDLRVHHLAKTKSFARKNKSYYFYKGESLYKRGFPAEFVILKSIQWFLKGNPSAGFNFLKGYTSGLKYKPERVVTPDEIKFIRKFQYKRLFCKIK